MSKGLGRLGLLLCLSWFALPAWAVPVTITYSVNGGAPVTYTDAQGTPNLNNSVSNGGTGAYMSFVEPGFTHTVYMTFLPLANQFLAPGVYDNAEGSGFQGPMNPGMQIEIDNNYCWSVSGRYAVRAVTFTAGKVTNLAVDFQQTCTNGANVTTTVGSLRYNDPTPIPYANPTADAGANQSVLQGATVTLDGSLSDGGDGGIGSITGYTWTQIQGTTVALSDTAAVKPSFTAPSEPSGGEDLVFQLEVDSTVGSPSFATVQVHVGNPADPVSVLQLNGYPGAGNSVDLTTLQASFTVTAVAANSNAGSGVYVVVNGGSPNYTLRFVAPKGQSLQAGTNYDVLPTTGFATMSTSGTGTCTGTNARFLVRDLQTDVNGNVTSLAIDFEQTCTNSGTSALVHGLLRYKSAVSLDNAWAAAGFPQIVTQGATVTLSGSDSEAGSGGDTITGYQWLQLSGPTATLSDPTAANPTFTAPAVSVGGADLVFQLTITTADGLSSTDTVTVHVGNTADAMTVLVLDSQPGDTLGGGNSARFSSLDSSFSGHTNNSDIYDGPGIWFNVIGPGGVSWSVEFVMPIGQTLQTGTFDPAQVYPWGDATMPRLLIEGPGNFCTAQSGQFTILDLQTGSGNAVSRFAVDFQARCGNASGELRGRLRYNSSSSAYTPFADAGSYQATVQGETVNLSAAASDAGGPGATITSYQWTQLSGPSVSFSDATAEAPSFTAPTVSPGGADVVLQVTITNFLGLTSSADVKVHVAALTDPAPTSRFYAVSDAGDTVGGGQTYDISGAQQTITASAYGNGYELMVGDYGWVVDLMPPAGQKLQAGQTYKLAQRYPFQSPVLPGLSAEGGGSGCNTDSGRFVILDVETDEIGNIVSFAADFEQDCDGESGLLHGFFRFNSSVSITAPFADAGPAQLVLQEAAVQLKGDTSFSGGGSDTLTSYQWAQVSGPAVTLSDASVADPSFSAPDVGAGGADLVFQLTVTNSEGLTSTDTVTVHVANPADPVTAIRISGDQGDWVSQGLTWNENTLVAKFTPGKISGNSGSEAHIDVDGGDFGQWSLDFAPPRGQTLSATAYTGAQRYPFQGSGPGLNVDGNGAGCNTLLGDFIIKDLNVAGDGTVLSFAADFEQQCDGKTPALHGKIRYNSTVSIDDPVAEAGQEQSVTQGDTVTLDGSATDPGGDGTTVTSWQWTQVSGPMVSILDPNAEVTTFVPGSVPLGGETLTFQLTVTNSLGLTSTKDVTILVANPADPQSGIYVQGTPDIYSDPVQVLARQPLDGSFSTTTPSANAVTVTYMAPDGGFWHLTFVPPSGQQFHTGTYTGVVNAAPADPSSEADIGSIPGSQAEMLVTDDYFYDACESVSGQFTVKQVSYDGNGNVTAFAADFKQFCSNGSGTPSMLRGRVRYQSTVTIRAPLAVVGPDQQVFGGVATSLDGSASSTPYGTLTGYSWTQIVNSGDPTVVLTGGNTAKPSFTAPDLVTGRTLTFQLSVSNSVGLTDQDVVHVQVVGSSDPKTGFYYQSDADDPDGKGATVLATASDGEFYARGGTGGVDVNIYPSGATAFDQVWEFTFSAGGLPLKKGVYSMGPFEGFGIPELIATDGACDQTGGMFVVRDVTFNQFGQMATFAADFVRHCQGASGDLRGSLRIRSTVPMMVKGPVASPGPAITVNQAATVTLDGSNSFPGWGTIKSYSWKQVGGPAVGLSGMTQPSMRVSIPANVLTNPGTVLTFALTVTDAQGLSDTETTTVTAALPASSGLSMHSDAGDPVGQGWNWGYSTWHGDSISVSSRTGAVTVKATRNGGATWDLQFAAPNKQIFRPGDYTGAVKFSALKLAKPGIYVNTQPATSACRTVSGDFKVLDMVVQNGVIASLAVDFDQTCNGASGALHGKLRYHSAVP